jgi:hypothetical protein
MRTFSFSLLALGTMESYLVNANKFAHKIMDLSKQVMAQQGRSTADPTVPLYHSERPARLSGMAY